MNLIRKIAVLLFAVLAFVGVMTGTAAATPLDQPQTAVVEQVDIQAQGAPESDDVQSPSTEEVNSNMKPWYTWPLVWAGFVGSLFVVILVGGALVKDNRSQPHRCWVGCKCPHNI